MCSYSMIADHFSDKWQREYPFINTPWVSMPNTVPPVPEVSRFEFEALRREVADLKELLVKAKDYDARNGEPDCEMAEKVALLRKVAQLVGVDLGDAVPKSS